LERQWLHAVQLGFAHPRTGKHVTVDAPYMDDLDAALTLLRKPR
jgi:23S rRNA pseudouridine1911/1915/1917 synthase